MLNSAVYCYWADMCYFVFVSSRPNRLFCSMGSLLSTVLSATSCSGCRTSSTRYDNQTDILVWCKEIQVVATKDNTAQRSPPVGWPEKLLLYHLFDHDSTTIASSMTYHMLHYFVDTLMFFLCTCMTVLLENCATLVVLMSACVTFDLRNINKRLAKLFKVQEYVFLCLVLKLYKLI